MRAARGVASTWPEQDRHGGVADYALHSDLPHGGAGGDGDRERHHLQGGLLRHAGGPVLRPRQQARPPSGHSPRVLRRQQWRAHRAGGGGEGGVPREVARGWQPAERRGLLVSHRAGLRAREGRGEGSPRGSGGASRVPHRGDRGTRERPGRGEPGGQRADRRRDLARLQRRRNADRRLGTLRGNRCVSGAPRTADHPEGCKCAHPPDGLRGAEQPHGQERVHVERPARRAEHHVSQRRDTPARGQRLRGGGRHDALALLHSPHATRRAAAPASKSRGGRGGPARDRARLAGALRRAAPALRRGGGRAVAVRAV